MTQDDVRELTASIVSAYVSANSVPSSGLTDLITGVYGSLVALSQPEEPVREPLTPAVSIKRSVTPDYIICLEDGLKFKSMKRHLGAHYSMTPEQYRERWDLPDDYPMVAPNYAAARSALAKASGLGRKAAEQTSPEKVVAPARKVGRPKKAAAAN